MVRGQEIRDRLDVIRARLAALALARTHAWPRLSAAGAARAHETAVAAGTGDVSEHQRRADFHRAAAAADERRAAG